MKLISSRSKGKHVNNDQKSRVKTPLPADKMRSAGRFSVRRKVLVTVIVVCSLVILFSASAFSVVRWQIQPFYDYLFRPGHQVLSVPPTPNIVAEPTPTAPETAQPTVTPEPTPEDPEPPTIEEIRSLDIFTFLIFGIDGFGNTDVIMVASFDSEEKTLDVVSIPRDTMVNVDWGLKKANSIQPIMRNRYRATDDPDTGAMSATVEEFSSILGFEVDFWVTINMQSFVALIDAIGGVRFDVPVSMNWSDPDRGYVFRVNRGLQTLNGQQALGVMRFRAGYGDADIGRVRTQGNFLKAAAEQLITNRDSINVTILAETFIRHVRTDVQLNHLLWFGREFLTIDPDNINFATMPGTIDNVGAASYITILVDEWLEMLNTKLSPLHADITAEDVSILTRGTDRRLYVTDGNWRGNSSWGATSRGPGPDAGTTVDRNP